MKKKLLAAVTLAALAGFAPVLAPASAQLNQYCTNAYCYDHPPVVICGETPQEMIDNAFAYCRSVDP